MAPKKSARKAAKKSKPASKKSSKKTVKKVSARAKATSKSQTKKRATTIPIVKSSGSMRSSLSPAKRPTARRAQAAFDGDAELELNSITPRGIGSDSAGQSGSDQGLSEVAEADSESVEV